MNKLTMEETGTTFPEYHGAIVIFMAWISYLHLVTSDYHHVSAKHAY